MKSFELPDLGEGIQEAEIVTWHVTKGDRVVTDQPLVSVETDKAIIEIPSPRSGRIARTYGEPGDLLDVGTTLVEFDDVKGLDEGALVGKLPTSTEPAAAAEEAIRIPERQAEIVQATPAVRALASRLGVDLATITPSGPANSVTIADIERAAGEKPIVGTVEPLRGVRRSMARNMYRAHAEVAATTVTDEADVERWPTGSDVTLRLLRAVGVGCRTVPALNASFDAERMERIFHWQVNVGIAVDTDDGLFVPVLQDITERSSDDLRRNIDEVKAAVRSRSITHEQLRGATISLSNFGTLGGQHATLIVTPPQVAILGAGRIMSKVVAIDGESVVHRILPLSLTFDHRVVTGGEAARFLSAIITDLERAT